MMPCLIEYQLKVPRLCMLSEFNDMHDPVYPRSPINTALHPSSPFYQHGLTLIPAWISNHKPSKKWDEITYPFLNFNGPTSEI